MSEKEDRIMEEIIEKCHRGEATRDEVRKVLENLSPETRVKFSSRISRFNLDGPLHPYDIGP